MNSKLKTIGSSIIIDILIAAAVATGYYLSGFKLIPSFLIAFGITFIIGYVTNITMSAIIYIKNYRLNKLIDLRESEQEIELSCATCKSRNFTFLDLKKDNDFICASCKQKNAVYMDFSTAIISEPLSSKIDLPKTLEDALNADK